MPNVGALESEFTVEPYATIKRARSSFIEFRNIQRPTLNVQCRIVQNNLRFAADHLLPPWLQRRFCRSADHQRRSSQHGLKRTSDLVYFGADEAASFWKAGSVRRGSQSGSSFKSAGVTGVSK